MIIIDLYLSNEDSDTSCDPVYCNYDDGTLPEIS
jgi:hypothetical protein